MSVRLVEVTRAEVVESIHRGDVIIVTSDGKTLYELGNAERLAYMRSSGKPFYTMAALEAGIAEKFGLDLKDIALMTSSHSGEKEHIEHLEVIMRKTTVDTGMLQCGVHEPLSRDAAKELIDAGQSPTKLHCNCSAKHIAMIATAKLRGLPVENYYDPEHPIQQSILKVLSRFSGYSKENIKKGVDGCGTPVHALPLRNMATAYANLCNEEFLDGKYAKSQNYVLSAMTLYPEMIGGTGRLDTELMKHFGDRLVCKFGDEGVYCVGLLKRAVGIALKIEDGNTRAVGPAIIEILLQMKVIEKEEAERLQDFRNPSVNNHRGEKVGEIRPAFMLRGSLT